MFSGLTLSWSGLAVKPITLLTQHHKCRHNARLQKVQTVIELDFDESEALCFLSFFLSFFTTLRWLAQAPPPPNPPSLTRRGGGVFCLSEESQRVCNNKPSIIPCNRGRREGTGEVFKGSTQSRTLYIVSLLIIVWWPTVVLKDVSLSIKKYKIFLFLTHVVCFVCVTH